MKEVALIFKTHLDMGFTKFAGEIVEDYLNVFIPRAIDVAYRLKDTDTPFIWTTGSWIIYKALTHGNKRLEQAIKDGLIVWHGLPYTSNTEFMSGELFKYGLSISKKLDKRFGKKTISAKMTDVPGHTIGMVPYMQKAGIEFLHIGVNPATPMPKVPDLFEWKCGGDSIKVMYSGGGYGNYFELGDFVIGFGHTGDNLGPQTAEEVSALYADVRKKYPGAKVYAATLDDVAKKLRGMDLPVVESEIGDSWIHGVGSDPKKASAYRAMLRKIKDEGLDLENDSLFDNLLLIPEHTESLDLKSYFYDYENYFLPDFERTAQNAGRLKLEQSWEEQRRYAADAASALRFDIEAETAVVMPDLTGFERVSGFDPKFEISYQLFTKADFERFERQYLQLSYDWVKWDFTRVGLPEYEGGIFTAKAAEAWKKGGSFIYHLRFEEGITKLCGLPDIYVRERGGHFEVMWFGKKANRLPEAFWLKLFVRDDKNWRLEKMGQWIDPKTALGNPFLHAVGEGVKNASHAIYSLDAPLVAPFGRKLLDFDWNLAKEDLYFNLYNNIWCTNFSQWYSDDARFRFQVEGFRF